MTLPTPRPRCAGPRDLLFFAAPPLWPAWPFLPVIRHRPDGEYDCGLLFDGRRVLGRCGLRATVFLTNLFTLPATVGEFLALPKEVYDTPEELAAAGWVVDVRSVG